MLRACPAHGAFDALACPTCGHEGEPLIDEARRTRLSKFLPDAGEPARPSVLYHGTAPGNLDPIREEGLRPMGRQEVHLSPDVETAREVGRRHADEPVVLRVDAEALPEAGIEVRRRAATVYTCKRVPARYVEVETRED